MVLIKNFNGGLGGAISKYISPPEFAQDIMNADIEYGYIQGVRSPTNIGTTKRYFYIFHGKLYEYDNKTEFCDVGNKLFIKEENKELWCVYQSYDDDGNKTLTEAKAGIENNNQALFDFSFEDIPEVKVELKPQVLQYSAMSTGTYTYRIAFMSNSKIVSYVEKSVTLESTQNAVSIRVFAEQGAKYRIYCFRESGDNFYQRFMCDADKEYTFIDTEDNILSYTVMPDDATDTDTVSVQYQFTYYNDEFEIESDYSPLSDVVVVPMQKAIRISQIPYSPNPFCTHIRIYRLGDQNVLPVLVATIENSTEKNSTSTLDVITTASSYTVLDSSVKRGICHKELENLCVYNNTIFGSIEERVYHSSPAEPEYWSDSLSFRLDGKCTAILPCKEGVLAFTKNRTYLIAFMDNTPTQLLITNDIGCSSHASCTSTAGIPIFANETGFYMYSNFQVVKLSHSLIGELKSLDVIDSIASNGRYYASTKDFIYTIDMTSTSGQPVITKIYKGKNIDTMQSYIDGVLYAHANGTLLSLFTGDERELFEYTTPILANDTPVTLYMYDKLYMIGDGRVEVRILEDNEYSEEYKAFQVDFNSVQSFGDIKTIEPVKEITINNLGYGVQLQFIAVDSYTRIHLVGIRGTAK